MSRKIPNAAEMGRLGGLKHKETKPPEYWLEIGMKGNEAMRKLGVDFYKERARKIAESRKRNKNRISVEKVAGILSGRH